MILSRPDILSYLERDELVLDPSVPITSIAQVSIDLRLGRKFISMQDPAPEYIRSIRVNHSLWGSQDLWQEEDLDEYTLEPGKFVLAQTLERVRIPPDLVGLVEGRSSWARVGVTIHVTAPKIDPGFDGHITLEMTNFGTVPVTLRAEEDQPAQLMLIRVSQPLGSNEVYGTGPDDRFQGQEGPLPSS